MGKAFVLIPGKQLFGQERGLMGCAKVLRELGYSVVIITHASWGDSVSAAARADDFDVLPLRLGTLWEVRASSLWLNLVSIIFVTMQLPRIFKRGDILVTGNVTFTSTLLLYLYMSSGITVVFRHGDSHARHTSLHRWLCRLVFDRANIMFANSNALIKELASMNFHAELLRNFVDVDRFNRGGDTTLPSAKDRAQPARFGYLGQLAPHKGVGVLLDVIEQNDFFCEFVFIGSANPGTEGEFERQVTKRIEALDNCSRLEFQSDISSVLGLIDVLICPSLSTDPSPNVVIEAKMFGACAIVSDVPGLNEMVTHETDGLIVRPNCIAELANAVRRLADDCDLRGALKCAAKQDFEKRYSKARYKEQLQELLN